MKVQSWCHRPMQYTAAVLPVFNQFAWTDYSWPSSFHCCGISANACITNETFLIWWHAYVWSTLCAVCDTVDWFHDKWHLCVRAVFYRVYQRQGRPEKALSQCERALELLQEGAPLSQICCVYRNMAAIEQAQGHLDRAIEHLLQVNTAGIILVQSFRELHCTEIILKHELDQGSPHSVLEGRYPAEFSSNLLQHNCLEVSSIPNKTLISWPRCVWLG